MQIIRFKNKAEVSEKADNFLKETVDRDTLLLLSGGTSPDELYKLLAQEQVINPGAVCLVDERYGLPMHINSNERMIKDTGFLEYIENLSIPFYGVLKNLELEQTALEYEKVIKTLFQQFTKKVAIMGIGSDGHIAGIKPGLEYDHNKLVVSYDDEGYFGKRVTLTFEALDKIDEFIILALGQNKKKALAQMLKEHNQKNLPAVFFKGVSSKTFLITDIL